MREIKFRVRDARTKEVIGYERINKKGQWEKQRVKRNEWLLGSITSEDNLIREQFTGAKDRDEVEIYEGDKDARDYVIKWSEEHCLFCQHFYQSYFDKWAEASYPMDAERVKIIGNIYESPSLTP